MRGIVLAGGAGSRLYPLTQVASKQLQPVHDKPMIYYPLSTLMLAGITDIMLISTPADLPRFQALLGDGSAWGITLTFAEQPAPEGIAQALVIGADFLGGEPVCLILGDNVFYGRMGLDAIVSDFDAGAVIFGYPVTDPQRYGIVVLDDAGRVTHLEEKPTRPRSNLAVPGLYLYDGTASERAGALSPSARGELEITDLNRSYLDAGELRAVPLGRGVAWLDSGTHESLLDAANFIATVEARQGMKISCPEEVAWRKGYVDDDGLRRAVEAMPTSPYRDYCAALAEEP